MSRFIRNTNYHTLKGFENEMAELTGESKAPVETVEIGLSTEGRPIKAVCFGDGDFRKPEILYYALVHSVEYIGAETALSLTRHFAGGGENEALNRMNIWIIPILNPDGYAAVESRLSTGLGLSFGRGNARGVDLNRNFPVAFYHLPRSIFAGSPLKISPHYRGEAPCSEAESALFRDFVLGRNLKAAISYHSFGASIMYPYNHTANKCRDHDAFVEIGGEMAKRQKAPYTVKQAHDMYSSNGNINDWLYDECGILAFLFEIGKVGVAPDKPESWLNPFYWYNPVEPRAEIDNVLPASLHLIEAAQAKFV